MKKVILVIAIVAMMIPVAFWGVSLIKCEILIHKYHNDFEQAYKQNTMLAGNGILYLVL